MDFFSRLACTKTTSNTYGHALKCHIVNHLKLECGITKKGKGRKEMEQGNVTSFRYIEKN